MTDDPEKKPLERVVTHVPGLDVVTKGGLFRGSIYMIMGRPGAGKTILGNQICFNHVAAGGRALYVTLLTESHARLLSGIEQMSFFQPALLGESLLYLSGYQALETDKLDGLLKLLRKAIRDHRATLLVIDGRSRRAPWRRRISRSRSSFTSCKSWWSSSAEVASEGVEKRKAA
jgi:circadian clock protein KaiC